MWLRAVGDKVIHSSCLRIINKMWNYRINEKKVSAGVKCLLEYRRSSRYS